MSAIYQRARPITWDEVVGQEQVKDVLRGALAAGKLGHAYLFSGPRGVGKTTTARLIAMTANCSGPAPKPCGECESCRAVRAGTHPDVLEIDAASNNSVDDVRDLREKVGLSAMRGGKKIYILDEAHMMSRAAFNALLKTLEEPPEHVIFILATTEPEKILPTIMSRCQHYRFRRLSEEEIAGKLQTLAKQEGVSATPDALQLLSRLADGAMRDGESLLERLLATGEPITRESVEGALGLPPSEQLRAAALALTQRDVGSLLSGAAALYRAGYAARSIVEGLITVLGEAIHAELGLGGEGLDADLPALLRLQAALDEQSARFARAADQQSLELALTHALLALDAAEAPQGLQTTEQSQQRAQTADQSQLQGRVSALERELRSLKATHPTQPAAARTEAPSSRPAPVRAAAPAPSVPQGSWDDVMRRASMQTRAFLKPARKHAEAGYVSLTYDEKAKFHAKQVYDTFNTVAELVLKAFGAVTFELISPEHQRKQQLGEAPDVPEAQPAPPVSPTPAPANSDPAPELPTFEPTRRARLRPAPPPSPDDAAPAPLPEPQPSAQEHAADPAPAPEQANPTETYISAEPLTQEPTWEDLPPFETSGPTPPRQARPRQESGASAQVRSHPNYREATRLFAGHVTEEGTVKARKANAETEVLEDDESEPIN